VQEKVGSFNKKEIYSHYKTNEMPLSQIIVIACVAFFVIFILWDLLGGDIDNVK
jgi:hypothetical protein